MLLPGVLAVAQILLWAPRVPGLLPAASTVIAFAALSCRRLAPAWAFGGTLPAAAVLGVGAVSGALVGPVWGVGTVGGALVESVSVGGALVGPVSLDGAVVGPVSLDGAVVGPVSLDGAVVGPVAGVGAVGGAVVASVAVLVALHSLAVRRTAGLAAAGGVCAVLVVIGVALAAGASARTVAGLALQAAGLAAVVWVMGRSRRRGQARRAAAAAYRARSASVPRLAAGTERARLMAELHDVAAHRLTGIVVSAAAATRLPDPRLAMEAARHAAEAGRQAVAELDRLAEASEPMTLEDIDALVSEHGNLDYRRTSAAAPPQVADLDPRRTAAQVAELDYRRTAAAVPPQVADLAYRVVREALTNAMRHAAGASRVRIDALPGELAVTVTDSGGTPAAADLGTGNGLAGLRSAVRSAGGSLRAGPKDGGWEVRAVLPLPPQEAPYGLTARRGAGWRGSSALDGALVILAIALSLGANLLPGDELDPFASTGAGVLLAVLFGLHALPLWWRRNASRRSLVVALATLMAWLGLDIAGWPGPPLSDAFLWCWWVELALVYAIGACRAGARDWLAPAAVAGYGGLALVSGDGITGDRPAAWLVLAVGLALPAWAAWASGRFVAARRRRRGTALARERDLLERDAARAATAERRRILDGLRHTARRHAQGVVDGADARNLEVVLAEARAGLGALRELLAQAREREVSDDPPPTVDGIAALAARRGGAACYVGARRPLSPDAEATAYEVARELLTEGTAVTVTFLDGGVMVSGRSPTGPVVRRRLRALADAADGTLTIADDGAAQVWLPEVFLS
ncbi:ATP-binding protein [Nonomuraea angiospora]|uniref:ATP-binding protein n=1 Tax=Nonomuraea angiospora TaxID=46172 RepID=UPI0029B5E32C|nr:ATP-binding protein [Nonomuraea angiospora]MDX3104213.1 histidine kinase [Nonomuraea angiospora]